MTAIDLADENDLAGLEYHGVSGSIHDCEAAVLRLLLWGPGLTQALILTTAREHALLLTTGIGDQIAIKSGFTSGYGGTGPRGFSKVLQLLDSHGVDIEECEVSSDILQRLDRSALTTTDLQAISTRRAVRPKRLYDYISEDDADAALDGSLWRRTPPVIPYSLLDPRLIDLALRFPATPDDCLSKGYRRLEDAVRQRTGLKTFGSKLFSAAFQGKEARLTWSADDEAEITGRANLFTGAFMAFRNPRAHREAPPGDLLLELLLLNQLFRLEADAIAREPEASA